MSEWLVPKKNSNVHDGEVMVIEKVSAVMMKPVPLCAAQKIDRKTANGAGETKGTKKPLQQNKTNTNTEPAKKRSTQPLQISSSTSTGVSIVVCADTGLTLSG